MSFRSGHKITLCVIADEKSAMIVVDKPTLFYLKVCLADNGINCGERTMLYVKRRKMFFIVECDRDVEELGSAIGEEWLYVLYDSNDLYLSDQYHPFLEKHGPRSNVAKSAKNAKSANNEIIVLRPLSKYK